MTLFLYEFIAALLSITLSMSTVIAVLLLLRTFMKKRFTASCRFIIWTLVMLRLCIPVDMGFMPEVISVSVFEEEEVPAQSPADISKVTFSESTDTFIIPQRTQITEAEIGREAATLPIPQPTHIAEAHSENAKPAFSLTPETVVSIVFTAWLLGAFAFASVCMGRYMAAASAIRKTSEAADESTMALYFALCEKTDVKNPPRLTYSTAVSSPMLYGYFSPTIVLPEISLGEDALKGVLSHELTHYKRGDIYLKLMAMLANALNWANPFVYAAASAFASEMELSCDEKVLRESDDTMRVEYGRVMLDIIRRCGGQNHMLTTGFNPSAGAVKERFVNILDSTKKKRGATIISLVLVICIVSGSLLGIEASAANETLPEKAEEKEEEKTEEITPVETELAPPETEPLATVPVSPEETEAESATEPETTDAPVTETTAPKETEPAVTEKAETTAAPLPETEPAAADTSESAHIHNYTSETFSPTCSRSGYTKHSCSCGDAYITDISSPTYKHKTFVELRKALVDGEETEYAAEICSDCGIEISLKKSVWDGTKINYLITGPFYFEGDCNAEGELVIYGSGPMPDYASLEEYFTTEETGSLPAWWLYDTQYDSIVIADKITSVGANAFNGFSTCVNTVKIGHDVSYIGKNAFAGMTELKALYLPRGIKKIEAGAFADASDVTIKFEGTYEEFLQLDLGDLSYANVELNTQY